jgi:hypothetical protein
MAEERNAAVPQDIDVTDETGIADDGAVEVVEQFGEAEQPAEQPFTGNVLIQLFDENGQLKDERRAGYLITDAGDLYYAGMAIALVTPAAPAQPTKMTGMKLGTGTTAVAKSGAGAALVTYITGSNNPFDATWPQTQNLGAGLGVNGQYKTSWLAGDVTNAAITEAVIVNDAATDATSTAANTAQRIVFSALNKLSTDSLVITWNSKFLGV